MKFVMKHSHLKTLLLLSNILLLCSLGPSYSQPAVGFNTSKKNPFGSYWLASTKLFNSTRLKRNSLPCEQFQLNLNNYKDITLCIYRQNVTDYNFVTNSSRLVLHESGASQTNPLSAVDYIRLIGYVIGQENSSKVDGYLYKKRFFGRILTDGGKILYVEDLVDYLDVLHLKSYNKEDSIIYENDGVNIICAEKLLPMVNIPSEIFKYIFKNPFGYWSVQSVDVKLPAVNFSSRTCSLAIFVDTAYYKLVMGSNEQKTLHSVVHSIHVANTIFRNTDFLGSGTPTNMGFVIRYIHIYKTSHDSPLPSFYPLKRDSSKTLYKFSSMEMLYKDTNLAILFTGQSFQGDVNGLSFTGKMPTGGKFYIGGLCFNHPLGGNNRNVLLVVGQGYSSRQTQLILDLTVTHEIGHSFGATHDVDPLCKGYIMDSVLNRMVPGKNDRFSPCAIEKISELLVKRHYCLEKLKDHQLPFCGNGIVEDGEECDCGSKYTCEFAKMCCYHFDSERGKPCTKIRNQQCHEEL